MGPPLASRRPFRSGGDGGGSNSPSRRYPDRDVLQVYPEIMFSCSGPVPARIKISLADCL